MSSGLKGRLGRGGGLQKEEGVIQPALTARWEQTGLQEECSRHSLTVGYCPTSGVVLPGEFAVPR